MLNGLPAEFPYYAGTLFKDSLGLEGPGTKFPEVRFPATGNGVAAVSFGLQIMSLQLIDGPKLQRGVLCSSIASCKRQPRFRHSSHIQNMHSTSHFLAQFGG